VAGAGDVLEDLRAESEDLDRLVTGAALAEGGAWWRTPTPAPGWTVAHQIAHLAWTDEASLTALREPETFLAQAVRMTPQTLTLAVDAGAEQGAGDPPRALLGRWRAVRTELAEALAALPREHRIPWYGPPMSAASMATARLMETWAHGEDVAAALGVRREPTARLRHVAWIGVRTRDHAYAVRGEEPPAVPFRVTLTPPGGGAPWTYGPEDAPQSVSGPAADFCALVTRRVHRDDTALRAEGADADHWLDIAQAFAGPPGPGRRATGGEAR
jgi:uncharacterized protein (TIGR03084 family)